MKQHWAYDAIFYHIYPLGLCGAPACNDFNAAPKPRLTQLNDWIDHIEALGANALYLGPVFESTSHGYDTADYYHVDRRLGDRDTLAQLSAVLHQRGIRVILDGVFNHVGRDFWAFRDLQQHGQHSAYKDWFYGLEFGRGSPYGDPFTYESWDGHYSLVKLNLHKPAVRDHLFEAVRMWVETFDIDGLRLDAADAIDHDFLRALAAHCRRLKPDFWLMGEVVHGDYRRWANAEMLDSTTNYTCYKGLFSSHEDKNYFELAYELNRLFGSGGIYQGLPLYNFADNHEVNRVASNLSNPAHLYTLYTLLFTMPGVPSIYYGSEWGIGGVRTPGNDRMLRPAIDIRAAPRTDPSLAQTISRLAHIRRELPALRHGVYRQLHIDHEQFAFARQNKGQYVIVAVNASDEPAEIGLSVEGAHDGRLRDVLNPEEVFALDDGRVKLPLHGNWARILLVDDSGGSLSTLP